MRIAEIIEYIDKLKNEINQYTQALIALRGKDWDNEIDKDQRPAVKNINVLRQNALAQLNMLLNKDTHITIVHKEVDISIKGEV